MTAGPGILADLTAPFVLLEDRADRTRPARLYRDPIDIISCDHPDHIDAALDRIETALAQGLHAAGTLAYELGHVLEPRLRPRLTRIPGPLLRIGLFPAPQHLTATELDAAFAALPAPPPLTDLRHGHDRASHIARIRRIQANIAAGDIYQANLTFQVRFRHDGNPLALYAALRCRQPTAHGALVALDDDWILSVSPESFIKSDGRIIETRPMKGTTARGADPFTDARAIHELVADPKQRAENLMITDLMRNDLSRIAEPGSVSVPHLFTPETHPTFHALTSTIRATLRLDLHLRDTLAAIFPCGSIVGAPKIRAAEILSELEEHPRGVYTGAIGAFAPDGGITLSVAIRTAILGPDNTGSYGVGGGIVSDSDPDAEYDEALLKARVITQLAEDFGLIETLRWTPTRGAGQGFVRLDRHLHRLAHSAATLGFTFDPAATTDALARHARPWTGDRRVRLRLARNGDLTIDDAPAPPPDEHTVQIGVATIRLDAADGLLRHKTTRRTVYDAAACEADQAGWADALILNRNGEIADGARHSIFAERDGRLITPPLAAGALAGVLRADLIADGIAIEGTLTPDDLRRMPSLLIGNSLRGLRPARLAPS